MSKLKRRGLGPLAIVLTSGLALIAGLSLFFVEAGAWVGPKSSYKNRRGRTSGVGWGYCDSSSVRVNDLPVYIADHRLEVTSLRVPRVDHLLLIAIFHRLSAIQKGSSVEKVLRGQYVGDRPNIKEGSTIVNLTREDCCKTLRHGIAKSRSVRVVERFRLQSL